MRSFLLTLLLLIIRTYIVNAQQIVLQPIPSIGIDASLGYHDNFGTDNNNYGSDIYLNSFCIPGADGGRNSNRALLKFDLSLVPANVTITSAYLELSATGFINSLLPGHFGNNTAILSRVAENWNEFGVTWNSEPSLDLSTQLTLPASLSSTQNYSANVTGMVSDMYLNPTSNFGFHLRLVNENPNNSAALTFYSSDYSTPELRPKLIINYEVNQTEVSFCTDNFEMNGSDASLGYHDNYGTSSTNYVNDLYLKAFCVPGASGGENTNRGLLYFNLSSIPVGSNVTDATLYLYGVGYINANFPGHFGINSSKIYRVSNPWNENTVTWDNQPSTISNQYVTLPQSTSFDQDYVITTTALVDEMVQNPQTNYGFMLQLDNEDPAIPGALAFHSSDGSNLGKFPTLCVSYEFNDTIIDVEIPLENNLFIPNVLTVNGDGINDSFSFPIDLFSSFEVSILNRWGNVIYQTSEKGGLLFWDGYTLSDNKCTDGVYYYTLSGILNDGTSIKKNGFITLLND